ncbi:hypothetical protein Cgig2_020578 [Carnegiea gigantea]|uniref:Uncharacterized protein n=1 Tax=Carnegiea gigantea TaxID=171969 RepID=A0A9Q1JY03_9CARY|nr:hypothetical protein Cgig2_020578 [Carnegiea gigantea]
MSTMTDAIMQQVSEQVKKVVEATSSARPLPHFEHVPTRDASPPIDTILQHPSVTARAYKKAFMVVGTSDLRRTTTVVPLGLMPSITITQVMDAQRGQPLRQCLIRDTLDKLLDLKSKSKPHAPRGGSLSGNVLLSAFHEQNGHTIVECRELRKALHQLADKGQINRFLKWGPRFLRNDREPTWPEPQNEECSTEIVATIASGYV